MPRAWLTIPSARADGGTVKMWLKQGYGVALFRDSGSPVCDADLIVTGKYRGYAVEVNELVKRVLASDPEAQFCIPAGDDIQPDFAHSPREIADQLIEHFGGTFGVCQFTGDRFGEQPNAPPGALQGAYSDRVAGSAWCGREFCKRIYGGGGPLWPEFTHMFVDQHLQCVAEKLGIFWQRRDLIHYHDHWQRKTGVHNSDCPEHLKKVNTQEHWRESQVIFNRLKAGGFAEAFDLLTVPSA